MILRPVSLHRRTSADLSITQFHTFRRVFEQGGYSAAAQATEMSIPTVWNHIHELERVYNVTLFEKVGRSVKPTPVANQLYEMIDKILVQLDSTFDLVSNIENPPITIVTGVRMLMEDLADPLAVFRSRHENPVLIKQGNEQRAEELILAGEADLALTLEPAVGKNSSLIHYEAA